MKDPGDVGAALQPVEPPLELDGHRFAWRLEPESPEALGEALRVVEDRGMRVALRGGGSRDGLGGPLESPDLLLSTAALREPIQLDAEEGVLRAGAGTPLVALREAIRDSGWELPLDPPGRGATLGGSLAAAASGPRFARVRDAVLGLDVALAGGARTRCGGRVVKNVTGYDLAKLYVGSLGSLGVIEAAWLRLRPAPEQVACHAAVLAGGPGEAGRILEAARRPTVRAAVQLDTAGAVRALPGVGAPALLLELAGDAATLERDAAWLGEELGATAVDAARGDALETARELQAGSGAASELRLRLALVPSALAPGWDALAAAGASLLAWPALGSLFASFALGEGDGEEHADPEELLSLAARVARAGRGSFRIESAPLRIRREYPLFDDDDGGGRSLMRALKERFDPRGTLNPGRLP